jgi:tRNA dimethylallyltransferase
MIKALAIVGPTASGKTALSLALAERLGCKIISCDSMQIYKGMDIGTAKATAEEQNRAEHFLIDFLDPRESFSVESYRKMAMDAAREISASGSIPLFVGGTGLYIDSVMRLENTGAPESNEEYRAAQMEIASQDGGEDILWNRLREVDPESAEKIHKNNVKRVIRALEIYDATGKTKTWFDSQTNAPNPELSVKMIALDFHNRDLLYDRVNRRVDIMMEEGLLAEVKALYDSGMLKPETTAAQAIGYKEIVDYLEGRCTLPEAVEMIKLSSRRYAKRQLTWFRHERDAIHLIVDKAEGGMKSAEELICEAITLVGEI